MKIDSIVNKTKLKLKLKQIKELKEKNRKGNKKRIKEN